MSKRRLYLAQVQNRYGENVYLPLSVGLLWAYARTFPEITEVYEFCDFLYLKESISKALARLDEPDLLGVSHYIWSAEWNKAFIHAVKEKWPTCTVIVGGVHVHDESQKTLEENPDFDFAIYGEGEGAFKDFLTEHSRETPDYARCGSLIWRDNGKIVVNKRRPFVDLKQIPSPYLDGVFDSTMKKEARWQVLQETHRGCIAGGASIVTGSGIKKIEDVSPSDSVLGFCEKTGKICWNKIERSAFQGYACVLRITTSSGRRVDATRDHSIFTAEGWKSAHTINAGDAMLCVREANYSRTLQNVFTGMFPGQENTISSGDICRESEIKSTTALQNVWRGYCGESKNLFTNLRPGREKGMASKEQGREGGSFLQGLRNPRWKAEERNQLPQYLFSKMCKRGYSTREDWRQESSEANGGPQKDFRNSERNGAGIVGADAQNLGRWADDSARFISSSSSARRTKQIRVERHRVYGEEQPSISLHRGLFFLDRPMPIWEEKESRLHSHHEWSQEGNLGAWDILAQQCDGGRAGDRGLCQQGVEVLRNLGRRVAGRRHALSNFQVSWEEVTKVETIGVVRVYDLINSQPSGTYFANGILVHNCPFACTFCAWGQAALTKVRPFTDERIKAEYDWMGQHQVDYLDNADANYAILKRDVVLTQYLADTKKRYGYPRTFRTSFTKNSNDTVWTIANVLHDAGMLKSVTLAMQSMDQDVLQNIHRKNIKFDHFGELVKKYEAAGIPTYTELIMGLPGETLASYLAGLESNLSAGQNSLFMYFNLRLPNTEQDHPEYIEKFGLKTVVMQAMLTHGTPNPETIVEKQEVIVATKAMPHTDWKYAWLISKIIEIFQVQGLLQETATWLRQHESVPYVTFYKSLLAWLEEHPRTLAGREIAGLKALLEKALAGGSWDCVDPRLGEISWPPEEFVFARLCCSMLECYKEMEQFFDLWQIPQAVRDDQLEAITPPELGEEAEWARECVWYGRKGDAAKKRKEGVSG